MPIAFIIAVILLGFEIGGINTVLTDAVMESSSLPRPVTSSGYSGVRFFGGAIGAPVGTAAAVYGVGAPFLVAALTSLIGFVLLVSFRRLLARANHDRIEHEFAAAAAHHG